MGGGTSQYDDLSYCVCNNCSDTPCSCNKEYQREYVKDAGDIVNKPAHYTTGKIEVIDFIEDQKLGFHLGNVLKYICRAEHKGTRKQDLQKAAWYLARAMEGEK